MAVIDLETERVIREDAMNWLRRQRDFGKDYWSQAELAKYEWQGSPIPLLDRQRGIRKPATFQAALSMRTVYRRVGQERPYEDGIGDDQLVRYKWRGTDPLHAENRALRRAMELGLPLIYFDGISPGLYSALFPVFIVGEEREKHQFALAIDEVQIPWMGRIPGSVIERDHRLYFTKQRLHQPRFRASVMRAYETRCAICQLKHGELLDAAHIIPDSHDGGDPVTSNGLSLCKIHHSAYDAHIIGVRPDFEIEINPKVLAEVDGPMLKFGIQSIHGQRLRVIPRARADQPDKSRLAVRFEEFRRARR